MTSYTGLPSNRPIICDKHIYHSSSGAIKGIFLSFHPEGQVYPQQNLTMFSPIFGIGKYRTRLSCVPLVDHQITQIISDRNIDDNLKKYFEMIDSGAKDEELTVYLEEW